jgi:FkbM family methyltransferase
MTKRYYDFEPGLPAVHRTVAAAMLRHISNRRRRHVHRFFTDGVGYIDQQISADGLFERGLVELMLDVAREHGKSTLYIDVGANIGNHLVPIAPHFAKVVGFDPHPVLFHVLSANVMANGIRNAELFNVGLATEEADATLVENSLNHGLSRVKERSRLSAGTFGMRDESFSTEYAIKLVDAHAFLERYASNLSGALIKIDVEGMESEILRALMPVIKKYRPLVAFEWFYEEQPDIRLLLDELVDYRVRGAFVRTSGNLFSRLVQHVMSGRHYELEDIGEKTTPKYYPLVFLIPKQ